jgi:hypothetical protein
VLRSFCDPLRSVQRKRKSTMLLLGYLQIRRGRLVERVRSPRAETSMCHTLDVSPRWCLNRNVCFPPIADI